MKKFVNDLGSILQISYELTLLMMGGKAVRACIDWIGLGQVFFFSFFFFKLNPIQPNLWNRNGKRTGGMGQCRMMEFSLLSHMVLSYPILTP